MVWGLSWAPHLESVVSKLKTFHISEIRLEIFNMSNAAFQELISRKWKHIWNELVIDLVTNIFRLPICDPLVLRLLLVDFFSIVWYGSLNPTYSSSIQTRIFQLTFASESGPYSLKGVKWSFGKVCIVLSLIKNLFDEVWLLNIECKP